MGDEYEKKLPHLAILKLNHSTMKRILTLLLCISIANAFAQTANIGPDEYAFRYTVNNNYGLFFNATDTRYEFLNDDALPVFGFNANTGIMSTDLRLDPNSDYLVGNNRFAFRSQSNPNYGLYFNAGDLTYDFFRSTGTAGFSISATTGSLTTLSSITLGDLFFEEEAGSIRWTGSDFEGYTGSTWKSFTSSGLSDGSLNAVPYFDGTTWQVSETVIQNDGNTVGIGAEPRTQATVYVDRDNPSTSPNGSTIEGRRAGLPQVAGGLLSWGPADSDAAIRGTVNWGNSYSAAVYGSSPIQYDNSAAVIGVTNNGETFGALAYRKNNDVFAGYFNGDVRTLGKLEVSENATISGNTTIGGNLNTDGNATVGGKITVLDAAATDSIAIDCQGILRYFRSDDWRFGESNNADGSLPGDFIFGKDDDKDFVMSTSEFRGAEDNDKNLGDFSWRWNTVFATNGTINTSDAREKKNVEAINYGLETVMALKPVSYEWIDDPMKYGTKLGFVAQDLLETIPEVVVTEKRVRDPETDEYKLEESPRYGVFYDDLIPVLTKAVQEQQGTIQEQNAYINDLEGTVSELREALNEVLYRIDDVEQDLQSCCFSSQSSGVSGSDATDKAELGQNIPNPFTESTIIQYYLPQNTTNAIIRVTDMEGSPVEDIQLGAQTGANRVEFRTQSLSAGTYLYSLFVDGEFIATKKMVIAR